MTARADAYLVFAAACVAVGLRPSERTLLKDCYFAVGNLLIGGARNVAIARRLIEAGYLAQVSQQLDPILVAMQRAQLDKLLADARAKQTGGPR